MKDLASRPESAPFYNQIAEMNLDELKILGKKIISDFKKTVKKLESTSAKNLDFLKEVNDAEAKLTSDTAAISILEYVHPKKEFRDYSSDFSVELSSVLTDYNFNQTLYRKNRDYVDPNALDETAKFLYKETMEGYKRSGIAKSKEIRNEISRISKENAKLASDFSTNIAEGTPVLEFDESQLRGCFEEFLSVRRLKNGKIKVTLVSSETLHILQNCSIRDTREEVKKVSMNYAKESNWAILPSFLNNIERIAQLAGYKNYADLSTEDKMIQSSEKAADFIKELIDSTQARVELELSLIKKSKKELGDDSELSYADIDYYSSQIASKLSSIDEEALKEYFPYKHVKNSILKIFEKMFSLTFNQNLNAKTWHKDVEAYNVEENGRVIGRFYLDMHPRKGKYNHACSIDIVTGLKDKKLPQNVLVCNFNKPTEKSSGLQDLNEVSTFFHEFGHLIHGILAGQEIEWDSLAGTKGQIDFIEAPSQLLEEILMDPQVLKMLTKHVRTGEQITDKFIGSIHIKESIFDKARLKGLGIARQAALSKQSLEVFVAPKISNSTLAKIERTAVLNTLKAYGDYYFIYQFEHLIGYYSNYYTYMWSLAIAKDLFTKFNKKDLLDPKVAEHYRKTILEPGGSKPAADLVKDFLGRDWNMDAFREYLKEGEELLART